MPKYFNFLELQNYVRFLYERGREVRANPTYTVLEQEDGTIHLYQGEGTLSNEGIAKQFIKIAKKILTKEQILKIVNEQAS